MNLLTAADEYADMAVRRLSLTNPRRPNELAKATETLRWGFLFPEATEDDRAAFLALRCLYLVAEQVGCLADQPEARPADFERAAEITTAYGGLRAAFIANRYPGMTPDQRAVLNDLLPGVDS